MPSGKTLCSVLEQWMELLLVAIVCLPRAPLTLVPLLGDSEKPHTERFHLTVAAEHPRKETSQPG